MAPSGARWRSAESPQFCSLNFPAPVAPSGSGWGSFEDGGLLTTRRLPKEPSLPMPTGRIDAHALRRQAGRSPRSPDTWAGTADHPRLPQRRAGRRGTPAEADPFEPVRRLRPRAPERDPHLWAVTLFDEVAGLGYDRSYPTFTRQIRVRICGRTASRARPRRAGRTRRSSIRRVRRQWDWLELPDPPAHWGWGKNAHLLVGALAHSSKWRGTLAPAGDQAHLIDALDKTTRKLGGLTKKWRFDRMTTVYHPDSGKVTATFAAVANTTASRSRSAHPDGGNPQGRGREGQPRRSPTLVANLARRHHGRAKPKPHSMSSAECGAMPRLRLRRRRPRHRAHGRRTRTTRASARRCRSPRRSARNESRRALVAWRGLLLRPTRAGPRPRHRVPATR